MNNEYDPDDESTWEDTPTTPEFKLTQGQQEAMDKFLAFIADPAKTVFRLEGYAGT